MPDLAFARESSSASFLFADVAGFIALTEVHGDEQAAKVVARFSRRGPGRAARLWRHARQDHRRCAMLRVADAYFFCTLTCAGEFARHPQRFAD